MRGRLSLEPHLHSSRFFYVIVRVTGAEWRCRTVSKRCQRLPAFAFRRVPHYACLTRNRCFTGTQTAFGFRGNVKSSAVINRFAKMNLANLRTSDEDLRRRLFITSREANEKYAARIFFFFFEKYVWTICRWDNNVKRRLSTPQQTAAGEMRNCGGKRIIKTLRVRTHFINNSKENVYRICETKGRTRHKSSLINADVDMYINIYKLLDQWLLQAAKLLR